MKISIVFLFLGNVYQVLAPFSKPPTTTNSENVCVDEETGTFLEDGESVQITFPMKTAEDLNGDIVNIEVTTSDGSSFIIRCEPYKDQTIIHIFTEGIRLESGVLMAGESNPCDEADIRKIISPIKEESKIKILYLWKDKKCRMSDYIIKTGAELVSNLKRNPKNEKKLLHAGVEMTGLTIEDCTDEVKELLDTSGETNIGVERLATEKRFIHAMEYYLEDFEPWKEDLVQNFPGNQKFSLICRFFKKRGNFPPFGYPDKNGIKNSDIYTAVGSVIYNGEDSQGIVIERFGSKGVNGVCSVNSMKVNEDTISQESSHITFAFKAINENCYERKYKKDTVKKGFFYETTIFKEDIKKLHSCPKFIP